MRLDNNWDIVIEPLTSQHDRKNFDCGNDFLNQYIKESARQHAKKNIGRTFVAVQRDSPHILGYYTVCTGNLEPERLPAGAGNLPRFPIPTLHLARLAVHDNAKGLGLGRLLLVEVLRLSVEISAKVGIYAVDVIAVDEGARNFYLKHDFIPLIDEQLHLFLPIKDILDLNLI